MRLCGPLSLLFAYMLLISFCLMMQAHAGSAWSIQIVDTKANVGGSSIALDSANNPHIAYSDYVNSNVNLMYASWAGSTWNTQTVDSNESVISVVSMALDSGDNPHLSYFRVHPGQVAYKYGDLMYAKLAAFTPLSASQLTVIVAVVVVVILAVLFLVYRIRRKGAKSPPRA
jgi:hypothetical protein